MTKQTIAQNWKLTITEFDVQTQQFSITKKKLGKFTAATIKEKVSAKYPSFRFKSVYTNGFGGYFVDIIGTTLEISPSFI